MSNTKKINDPAQVAQPQSIQESKRNDASQSPEFYRELDLKMNQLKLKIKRAHPDAIIPTRAYGHAAAYDLYALHDMEIESGSTVKIDTGIIIEPPPGYCGVIKERSGLGSKGLSIRAGLVDWDFRGSIQVLITNTNLDWAGCYLDYRDRDCNPRGSSIISEELINYYDIKKGDKIAQIMFVQYGDFEIQEVEDMPETERGDRGFGSSDTISKK